MNNLFFDYQIFLKQKYGGPSKYFIELNNNFDPNEINSEIIAPFHINRHLHFSKHNKKNFFLYKKFFFNSYLEEINKFLTLRKLKKKNLKNSIIHSTYYNLEYLKYIECKKVVTVYDLIHEKFSNNKKINKSDNKISAIQNADFFICISKNTQNDLVNFYNVDKNKTKVIYLSSNLIDGAYEYKKKRDYILFVGNRSGYKNAFFLIKALSEHQYFKKNLDLNFFGGPKFSKDELNNFRTLNIIKNINHLGNDEKKLKSYYKNALCLVYPSLYEGFGIPLLEAMENECPIICNDNAIMREVADEAALYFKTDSHESLIECIDKIVFSKDCTKKLKKTGLKRRKIFSWTKCAKETVDVYKQL